MPYIEIVTTVTSKLYVEEDELSQFSDGDIQDIVEREPEFFGVDNNPHIDTMAWRIDE